MLDLLLNIAVIFCLFIIHESGHYLAGRVIGIPGGEMKIRLFTLPPHVALIGTDGSWISPTEYESYIDRLSEFSDEEWKDYTFVAGGHATELFGVAGITAAALISGSELLAHLAELFVIFCLILSVVYLLMDLFYSIRNHIPFGDFSGQWMISKGGTFLFYLVYFSTLAGLLWLIP